MKKQEPEVTALAEFETAVVPAPAAAEPALWTLGAWGEFVQWQCVLCPWDTLDGEEAMRAHYVTVHAPPPPAAPAPTVLRADRFGNPV